MLQLILLTWLFLFHPFYVSVTEIRQDPKTNTVQVSVRIFFDDLERALSNRYKTKVNILKPLNKKQTDLLIAAYVKNHLKLKGNNKDLNLSYSGYEIEEEAAWCYFETQAIEPLKSVSIQDDILFEQHREQINMIHVVINNQRKSTKLDNPESHAAFSF